MGNLHGPQAQVKRLAPQVGSIAPPTSFIVCLQIVEIRIILC